MEALDTILRIFSLREIVRGAALCAIANHFIHPNTPGFKRHSSWAADSISFSGLLFVYFLARAWLELVNDFVPEPYLDEVFHIPQAQTYCEGRFFDWDDKITTPPGLYLISIAVHYWNGTISECTSFSLRGTNLAQIIYVFLLSAICRNSLEATAGKHGGRLHAQTFSLYSYHSALNTALFPVLFFFSGLYYTDVASTVAVLCAYQNHLGRISERPGILNDIWAVLLGISTLFMRQTNVFWVVVYMGGMEAFHAVRSLKGAEQEVKEAPSATLFEISSHYLLRYANGDVHDPPLSISYPDDYLFCALSYAIAVLANPLTVIRQVWPHITTLIVFAGFVAWNGSVVLGDKSNHVATIHLSQLLYIWPLFAFFSAPLIVTSLLHLPTKIWYTIFGPRAAEAPRKDTRSTQQPTKQPKGLLLGLAEGLFASKLYYVPYLLGTVLLSLAIVHYNTIIHPFTLADNRHYMFYVFRYTIRRPGLTKYLLVAAYTASRWMVWGRLSGCSPCLSAGQDCLAQGHVRYINTPFPTDVMKAMKRPVEKKSKTQEQLDSAMDNPGVTTLGLLDEPTSSSAIPPTTSTAMLWLLTTSLSLVTAPLVEPRYFILPWVFWRLLVPAWNLHSCRGNPQFLSRLDGYPVLRPALAFARKVDLTLLLETVWFLAINLGTMYIFLFKPYHWFSEEGDVLDGGRLQRFMW